MTTMTIGLDIAKGVFQVHGVDGHGTAVIRRQLRRGSVLPFFKRLPPSLVGLEAGGGAHYWARELAALGHAVRVMPARDVKAYVRRHKTDAGDAAAICEAVGRPSVRSVPVKSAEQQAALMLHRVRDQLIRQRTMTVNALRAHLAEFGIVAPKGLAHVARLIAMLDKEDPRVPPPARAALRLLAGEYADANRRIDAVEAEIAAWHRANPVSRRLATIPGIGPITASAMVATVSDPSVFARGRDFAAWLGLTPGLNGTGGKIRPGALSRQGDRYIRRLMIIGAMAVIRHCREPEPGAPGDRADWLQRLLARRPKKVAAVALANKSARIAWALMVRDECYRPAAAHPKAAAA